MTKTTTNDSAKEKDLRVVSQIQKELKRQLSLKADVKEKPTEQRRHSLDSARLSVASVSSCNGSPAIPEFALQSNEQTVQWRNAVESWLSRPHPLGGTEADLQKATASSANVVKASHRSDQHGAIPRPQDVRERNRGSTEQQMVIPGRQDVHGRLSLNSEEHRSFSGKEADDTSRQQKQEKVVKKDTKPSLLPLVIRKEEHREDPRLKMRHSLDEEPSTGLKSPNAPQTGHSIPYNAQEALLAQGVRMESTSTAPVASSSSTTPSTPPTPSSPHLKYQVNDKSIKELLEKMNLQKREESSYKVTLDDGTRRALEIMKQQEEAKKRKPELQETNTISVDKKPDGKLDTSMHTNNQKPVKRSSSSVSATQEKEKRIKTDPVNPVSEKTSTVKTEVQKFPSREQPKKHKESRKEERQRPTERSEKKPPKSSQSKVPKKQTDSASDQEMLTPVVAPAVPELTEAPFPKMPCPDTLRSPPTSDPTSKAPKLKLILKPREPKEISGTPSIGDNSESSENKLTKQCTELENEQKVDLESDRKSVDSPVNMDISPQCTTPSGSGSASPITVVSSKGRYNLPTTPTTTLTTPVPTYSTPVTSAFPFTPPLPQGPFRSPISPCQPRLPPTGQQQARPMPFGPTLSAVSSSGTTLPLPPAPPPMFHSSPIVSVQTGGPLPVVPPSQAASSFVPQSAIPVSPVSPATPARPTMATFAGSPSFPPPPPVHPATHQRKSSLDALPNASVSSSAGQFPTAFPGQQWAPTPPPGQRIGFPTTMAPLPGVVAMSPTEVPQWPTSSALPRPCLPPPGLPPRAGRPPHVFPQPLGVPLPNAPFPGAPAEMPVIQPHGPGGGFVPAGVPRFPVPPGPPVPPLPPVPPAGPPLPQLGGVSVAAQMAPVRPMFVTPPVPLQFQPRIPFQQPARPIGYWVAPIKATPASIGKSTGPVGGMQSQSPGQKHSKESQSTPSAPKKNVDSNVEKAQKEGTEQKKEASKDVSSEGPKSSTVQKRVDKDGSNAQLEKQSEVAVSTPGETDANNSKEDKVVIVSQSNKETTPSKDKEITTKAIEESDVGSVKELSINTDKIKVTDSEEMSIDQQSHQEPNKPATTSTSSPDSVCSKPEQTKDETEVRLHREDSTIQTNKGNIGKDAESVSSKMFDKIEEPRQVAVDDELQISSFRDTKELPGNFDEKHSDVSVNGNSVGVVEVEPSFYPHITTYQTEAERKGSKAVSKIYDILRQNAQQARSETDTADQEEEEDLDDPDKLDNPDTGAMDDELNADEEGGESGVRKLRREAENIIYTHCSALYQI